MLGERQWINWFGWLLAATGALLLLRLGAAPIYILDEAKNAQCAREMWESGQWVVPTFNGGLRTDKPVLHYWFMIIAYKTFGFGPWQARLGSVLMGLLTVVTTFWAVRRWLDAATAFFSALVLCMSIHVLFEFRLAVPDPYLIAFTTLGLAGIYGYLEERSWFFLLLGAGSLALACLAKGPVALGLPGLVAIAFIVLRKQWWVFSDWRLLVAGAMFATISVPWYWAVHKATQGAFTQGFFFEHNLNRFSSEMEGHGGPFILVPLMVWVGLLPFAVLVPKMVTWVRRLPKRYGFGVFALVAALVYIIFFSASKTKLPNYAMPAYPWVAVLLGGTLAAWWRGQFRWPAYGWVMLLVLGLALAVGGWFGLQAQPETAILRWLSIGLLAWPITVAIAWYIQKAKGNKAMLAALCMGYFLFYAFVLGWAYPAVYRQNPISRNLGLLQQPNTSLVAFKQYNPAINPNLDTVVEIPVLQDVSALEEAVATAQRAGRKLLVVTREEHLAALSIGQWTVLARQRDLFELPTTVLLLRK